MIIMKKVILCLALAAAMAMTGCGKDEASGTPDEGTPSAEVTSGIETEASDSEEPEETNAPETEAPEETEATEATETNAPETEATETNAPATEAPADNNDSVNIKTADDFMNILNSDKMYLEMSAEQDGMAASVTVAADFSGGKKNMYMNMNLFGIQMVMLSNENGSYLIDNANKCYYTSEDSDDSDIETIATTSYKKTGSGIGTLNGESCSYCQYDIVNTDGETGVYKVYFKGGRVIAIEVDGAVMTIKNYSAVPPAGIFDIPAGYTEKSMEDMFSFEE